MRRSRRVGAARGERIRVAREPRERRGRRLVDVGVTTTGAGNAAARTAMRADGDADGAIDTDESADSDDDDGSGACSGGARGGVHEHASASACAATSRIHSKSWRVAGIFLITLIRWREIAERSRDRSQSSQRVLCARVRVNLAAFRPVRSRKDALGRVVVCTRASVGVLLALWRAFTLLRVLLSCARIRVRDIFQLLELVLSDHARQLRYAAAASAPHVPGCVRCSHACSLLHALMLLLRASARDSARSPARTRWAASFTHELVSRTPRLGGGCTFAAAARCRSLLRAMQHDDSCDCAPTYGARLRRSARGARETQGLNLASWSQGGAR